MFCQANAGLFFFNMVKNSFDLENHIDGVKVVVVVGGGGQHGLENQLMVLFYLRMYLPPISWPCILYCSDEADCYACLLIPAPHAAAQTCKLGCFGVTIS